MEKIKEKQKLEFYVVKNGKTRQVIVSTEKGDGFVYYAFMSHKNKETGEVIISLEKVDDIVKFCGSEDVEILHVNFEKMKKGNPYEKMFEILYHYAKTKLFDKGDGENKEEIER